MVWQTLKCYKRNCYIDALVSFHMLYMQEYATVHKQKSTALRGAWREINSATSPFVCIVCA